MKAFKPGISFGDFVIQDSMRQKSRIPEEEQTFAIAPFATLAILILLFGLLVTRLFVLQIIQGSKLRVLADENRIKKIKIVADRGKFFDRNGLELKPDLATSHILGYMGRVQADEVGLLKEHGGKYEPDDWIGRSGLQAKYEDRLRGSDGGRLIEVDYMGEQIREIGNQLPTPGENVHLTIDAKLQRLAYEAMANQKGAVVISSPQTGELLALVSSPGYDPLDISSALNDPKQPLFNRAVSGVYPPGSTFKMVVVAAAISEGKALASYVYEDTGKVTLDKFTYSNWFFTQYGGVEGTIGFAKALARSTDTFFYILGEKIGPDLLASWAKVFGFGEKTYVDLPGEASGLVPDPQWKKKVLNSDWYVGNTYHFAIGQGDLLATPIQVNRMTNAFATNGRLCRLYLDKLNATENCPVVKIDPEAAKVILAGMTQVCSEGGTAPIFINYKTGVACKTGTAEYLEKGKMQTHAWFTLFTTETTPQLSITVLVEGGGEGSKVAAPIAKKILDEYLK